MCDCNIGWIEFGQLIVETMSNPITVQKQVRENGQDVQAFLNDLSTWSTHMKAKELAESGADLLVQLNEMMHKVKHALYVVV